MDVIPPYFRNREKKTKRVTSLLVRLCAIAHNGATIIGNTDDPNNLEKAGEFYLRDIEVPLDFNASTILSLEDLFPFLDVVQVKEADHNPLKIVDNGVVQIIYTVGETIKFQYNTIVANYNTINKNSPPADTTKFMEVTEI